MLFSTLRGPLCAGEAFGQAPARPCLYVKPAGAPSGLLGKVLLAALRARQKEGLVSRGINTTKGHVIAKSTSALVRHRILGHRPAVAPSSGSRSTIKLPEVVSTRSSSLVAE